MNIKNLKNNKATKGKLKTLIVISFGYWDYNFLLLLWLNIFYGF